MSLGLIRKARVRYKKRHLKIILLALLSEYYHTHKKKKKKINDDILPFYVCLIYESV